MTVPPITAASLSTTDVTNSIQVNDPENVLLAVKSILEQRYPRQNFKVLDKLFTDLGSLYRGEFPGFHACETDYHDLQHVLDVTLAYARLLDGYEAEHELSQQMGANLALLGVIVSLFHDSGYIRRVADRTRQHGAEYTKTHVSRSAQFMANYLPRIGLGHHVALAEKIVHFTGYELNPSAIPLDNKKHHVLGALIGTADVIAQMSDDDYLHKCYDYLYEEFRIAGVTEIQGADGNVRVIYASPEELMKKTPQFMQSIVTERLDGHFDRRYRYVEAHFDGDNHYMNAMFENKRRLEQLLSNPDTDLRACLSRQ